MSAVSTDLAIVWLLIIANGVFAMSEFAVISARRARLRQKGSEGNKGALVALELLRSPNRFLSTVQVGITLIGILAGAVGGSRIADELATVLARIGWIAAYSHTVALVIVVLGIAYLTLVIGELVPKRIALNNPERIAMAVARPMRTFARVMAPLVHLLSASTRLVLRLLGLKPTGEPPITEEELRALLQEGADAGVFDAMEQDMVESVLLLDNRRASGLMSPRPEVVWLDVEEPINDLLRKIIESSYSRFPVGRGSLDNILGEVQARDLLGSCLSGEPPDLTSLLRKPLLIPETMPVLKVLEAFRQLGTQMALVIDEYGSVQGVVTLTDILEAIVGDIPSENELADPFAVQREDGSWLLDGMISIENFRDIFDIEGLPGEGQGLYQTIAGFTIVQLGHFPEVADHFEWGGLRFEVVDMDGPRIDKMLVRRQPDDEELSELTD